jgi:hypothetical protein
MQITINEVIPEFIKVVSDYDKKVLFLFQL